MTASFRYAETAVTEQKFSNTAVSKIAYDIFKPLYLVPLCLALEMDGER